MTGWLLDLLVPVDTHKLQAAITEEHRRRCVDAFLDAATERCDQALVRIRALEAQARSLLEEQDHRRR